jgi:tryptophan-rich sensory protein
MNILIFIASAALSFGLPNLVGASYKEYTADWYKNLKKPKLAAPDWVFIAVFPIFYLLEAIGLFLIFTTSLENKSLIISLFLASAFLSGIWSRLFFSLKRCRWSIITFVLEIPIGIFLVYLLFSQDSIAWLFFVPRVIWGFYAIIPNIQFYRLNKNFWNNVNGR